jgi:transposase
MERWQFTEEFKREAVMIARQPGASKPGIARDLGINANMLARWAHEQEGRSQPVVRHKAEAVSSEEFERMRRELAKVKAERDILKRRSATSRPTQSEVRVYRQPPQRVAYAHDVPGARRVDQRFLRLVRTSTEPAAASQCKTACLHP